MQPGKRNRRITIQVINSDEPTITNDDGYQIDNWINFWTCWAFIKNVNGREFFQAQACNSSASCRMNIRYKKEISSKMRVIYNGKIFNILYVDDINEAHKEIELLCEVIE